MMFAPAEVAITGEDIDCFDSIWVTFDSGPVPEKSAALLILEADMLPYPFEPPPFSSRVDDDAGVVEIGRSHFVSLVCGLQ